MQWDSIVERLVWSGAGALVSLGVAYVVVGKDLAYLKGSMRQVLDLVVEWAPMREKHAVMAADIVNVKADVRELKFSSHNHHDDDDIPNDRN